MSSIMTKYLTILKKHLVVFFKIISVINCVNNSLLKVSYCAKIGNLVISPFTSHDNIYVKNPVHQGQIQN